MENLKLVRADWDQSPRLHFSNPKGMKRSSVGRLARRFIARRTHTRVELGLEHGLVATIFR